jgi:hypothetical protein
MSSPIIFRLALDSRVEGRSTRQIFVLVWDIILISQSMKLKIYRFNIYFEGNPPSSLHLRSLYILRPCKIFFLRLHLFTNNTGWWREIEESMSKIKKMLRTWCVKWHGIVIVFNLMKTIMMVIFFMISSNHSHRLLLDMMLSTSNDQA